MLEDDVDERREARFTGPQRRWPVAGDDTRQVGVAGHQSLHAGMERIVVQPRPWVVAHLRTVASHVADIVALVHPPTSGDDRSIGAVLVTDP